MAHMRWQTFLKGRLQLDVHQLECSHLTGCAHHFALVGSIVGLPVSHILYTGVIPAVHRLLRNLSVQQSCLLVDVLRKGGTADQWCREPVSQLAGLTLPDA